MLLKKKYFVIASIVVWAGLFSSCSNDPTHPGYEFMPDMYRSASYETYSENPNFADGMTARTPVSGTVPRGFMPFGYPHTEEGYEAAGRELKNPLPENELTIVEGQRLYNIYCVYCHGNDGTGNGNLVASGKFPPPPSFSGPLSNLPEGKAYWAVTYGRNLMGSHASQILPDDRWKIIMYVKQLQQGANGAAAGPAPPGAAPAGSGSADTTAAGAQVTTPADTTAQQN